MSAKQSVLEAIRRLPDDADFEVIADEVAFLAALRTAEEDIRAGRLVSNESARDRLESWITS
jgi:predicted transcriptional regulator